MGHISPLPQGEEGSSPPAPVLLCIPGPPRGARPTEVARKAIVQVMGPPFTRSSSRPPPKEHLRLHFISKAYAIKNLPW